jgi:uncharacterized protein (DUF2384 family)
MPVILRKPKTLNQGRVAALRLLTEIREKAGRLFKGKEAEAWLRTANPVLRGRSPLEHLRMPGGLEEIRDLLGRIEWGIPT